MIVVLLASLGFACDPEPRRALLSSIDRADAAWQALDGDGLDAAMTDLRAALAVQCAPIDDRLSVKIHLAFARHAWTLFDSPTSVRAFLAVRDLSPTWTPQLDADVPADHPVRQVWTNRPGWTTTIGESPPGGWLVDGSPGPEVPKDRAFVLQALSKEGSAVWSGWLVNASEVPVAPWRAERVRRIRTRGTVLSLGVAAAGGGLIAAGIAERGKLNTAEPSEYLSIQRRSNTLQLAGVGTTIVAGVGLGLLWGIKW
jgi:hypothetical protein